MTSYIRRFLQLEDNQALSPWVVYQQVINRDKNAAEIPSSRPTFMSAACHVFALLGSAIQAPVHAHAPHGTVSNDRQRHDIHLGLPRTGITGSPIIFIRQSCRYLSGRAWWQSQLPWPRDVRAIPPARATMGCRGP